VQGRVEMCENGELVVLKKSLGLVVVAGVPSDSVRRSSKVGL
jgi:hypothetical protein